MCSLANDLPMSSYATLFFNKNSILIQIIVVICQDIAWFDDPNHETGILSSHLAMEASLVQGVSTS